MQSTFEENHQIHEFEHLAKPETLCYDFFLKFKYRVNNVISMFKVHPRAKFALVFQVSDIRIAPTISEGLSLVLLLFNYAV